MDLPNNSFDPYINLPTLYYSETRAEQNEDLFKQKVTNGDEPGNIHRQEADKRVGASERLNDQPSIWQQAFHPLCENLIRQPDCCEWPFVVFNPMSVLRST